MFQRIRERMLDDASLIFTGLPGWALDELQISDKDILGKIVNGFVNRCCHNGCVEYIPMEIKGIILLYVDEIELYADIDNMESEREYEQYGDDLDPEWSQ